MPAIKLAVAHTTAIYIAQKGRCIYCNHDLIPGDPRYSPTAEHIIPKSEGGKVKEGNISLACKQCNHNRNNLDIDMFLDGYVGTKGNERKIRGPKRWYHGNIIKW